MMQVLCTNQVVWLMFFETLCPFCIWIPRSVLKVPKSFPKTNINFIPNLIKYRQKWTNFTYTHRHKRLNKTLPNKIQKYPRRIIFSDQELVPRIETWLKIRKSIKIVSLVD